MLAAVLSNPQAMEVSVFVGREGSLRPLRLCVSPDKALSVPWREKTKRSVRRMEDDNLCQNRCVENKGFCFAVRAEMLEK